MKIRIIIVGLIACVGLLGIYLSKGVLSNKSKNILSTEEEIRNSLSNLYGVLLAAKSLADNTTKYSLIGKITNSSAYPNAITVFGAALRLDNNGRSVTLQIFDKCVHLEGNFLILKPDEGSQTFFQLKLSERLPC